jgi:hypothetical protein
VETAIREELRMLRQLAGAIGGLFYWFLLMFFAMISHGPEHGWVAPLVASLPGVLLIPITGSLLLVSPTASEATQLRRTKTARILIWLLVALDIAFVAVTISQVGELMKNWSALFGLFLLGGLFWIGLWGLVHYVVIGIAAERM